MSDKPKRVREPVQVYLDTRDRSLLDALSTQSDIPKAEVLRLGLRRLSTELLGDQQPGASLPTLVGSLDGASDVPADLAARHDEYLYQWPKRRRRASRKR